MTPDDRLDRLERKIDKLTESTIRLEEQMVNVRDSILPLKSDITEQCKREIKAWGWKSVTSLTTAVLTGLSGLAVSLLSR